MFYKSTFKSAIEYVADIVIVNVVICIVNELNFDKLYLPEPPTPTNKA